jgi:hypothetical protein
MPRLAFKPDSSFFRKIAIGAIGTRAITAELGQFGHHIAELERGSLDTKLWKDVKRKRVRIPDLVCVSCGLRIESRAKTRTELTMSHSPNEQVRAWDFGMVDYIAFPICQTFGEKYWSAGHLGHASSYWHERNWIKWEVSGRINYFQVAAFRATPHARIATKGVTEGSETSIGWNAMFSTRSGTIDAAGSGRITIRRGSDGHRNTRTVPAGLQLFVSAGEAVEESQVVAAVVSPVPRSALACPRRMPANHISILLASRERTQRFAGVKLARLRAEPMYRSAVESLAFDSEEDVYIRLEGASYLASVCGLSARELFRPYLSSVDDRTQLEAVSALGETAATEAVELLSEILDDATQPYFVRSAAAWCLGRQGTEEATARLVRAFSDVDRKIREEALEGLVSVGGAATHVLLAGLREMNEDIVAGCAEALRRQPLPPEILSRINEDLHAPQPSKWVAWLAGFLPRDATTAAIAELQNTAPQLHYAISLLWSFIDSWISRRWELNPGATFPESDEAYEV